MKIHIGWVIYIACSILALCLIHTKINDAIFGYLIYLFGIVGGVSLWPAIDK